MQIVVGDAWMKGSVEDVWALLRIISAILDATTLRVSMTKCYVEDDKHTAAAEGRCWQTQIFSSM